MLSRRAPRSASARSPATSSSERWRSPRCSPAKPAARTQRDWRARAHESRPRAAGCRGARSRRRDRRRVLESRARPDERNARLASGSPCGPAAPGDRRRGRARREQQRGRRAARARGASPRDGRSWSRAASSWRSATASASPTCWSAPAPGSWRWARPTARGRPTTSARSGRTPRCSCACTSRTSASSASASSRRCPRSPRSRAGTSPGRGRPRLGRLPRARGRAGGGRVAARRRRPRLLLATSCSAGRRRASSRAGPTSSRAYGGIRSSARSKDKLTLAALEGTLALYLDAERAAREIPVLRMLREPPRTYARGRNGWPRPSAARSSRRSRASAAARCRSRSCRASPAPSRSRSRPRSGPATRRSSRSSATAGRCSTAARSRMPRSTRPPQPFSPPADESHRRHRRAHRPRQDGPGAGAHRQGHRPAAGGAAARYLDRPRLCAARAAGRAASVVDVPGHERFVRTMVAGATGIDLFLLVPTRASCARPQTHEHPPSCGCSGSSAASR